MRKLAVVAILVVVLVSCGLAFAFQNEPDGFRGLKWGEEPSPEMEFVMERDDWMSLYKKSNEKYKMGDAQVALIVYQFYTPSNTRVKWFLGVSLYYKNKKNFRLLETICKAKFGEPTKTGFYELYWTSLASMVNLTYDSIEESGYLGIGSMPIFKQYTEEKKKKQIEEAEKDW